MKIPNFRTRKGSELYTMTAGRRIAPRIAEELATRVIATLDAGGTAESGTTAIEREMPAEGMPRLLDVACGPGTLTLRLAQALQHARVVGVDASSEMIERAQVAASEAGLRPERVAFAAMDAHRLTFDAATFDAATCNLGFPFFAHPIEALNEVGRVLVPGGRLWASVPDRESWRELFQVVHEAIPGAERLLRAFIAKLEQAERLLPSLEQAGYTVTEREYVRLPFTFADGREAIAFFNSLFSLFTVLPPMLEGRLARILDARFPRGVRTQYVALLACAQRAPRAAGG